MTEEQVKRGECGGKIIPDKAKTVPEGSYIYEFNVDSEHIDPKTGKYIKHYPGYLDGKKHPNGLCAPCCFKNKQETPAMKKRKVQCELAQRAKDKGIELDDKVVDGFLDKPEVKGGILAATTYPLDINRYGFLPNSIQEFLNIETNSYFAKGTKKIILNKKHVLRIGVENNKNQSFVGAISKIYSIIYKTKLETIKEFKQRIIKFLNLDNFLSFQNGNLFNVFLDDNFNESLIDVKKYESTFLYKNLMKGIVNKQTAKYFKKYVTHLRTLFNI